MPGYPLHEIVSAPLVRFGGSMLSNAGTLAITLACIVAVYRIAMRIGRFPRLLVVSFAFAPVVWQHSAVTLDYLWSLFFLLLSFLAAINKRMLAAGIFLGLAAGFRLSNAAALIPIVCLLYAAEKKMYSAFIVSLAAVLTTTAAYAPLIFTNGLMGWWTATQSEMADVHPDGWMRLLSFGYRMVYFAGPLTTVIVVSLFWKKRSDLFSSVRRSDPIVVFSVTGIIVFALMFLWLPLERAYLLPMLLFVLLLIDRFFRRREFVITAIVLFVSGLVTVDVIDSVNRRKMSFSVHAGMVVQEFRNRCSLLDERNRIAQLPLVEPAVVITGSGPSFWFENELLEPVLPDEVPIAPTIQLAGIHQKIVRQKTNPKIFYVPYVTRTEIDSLRARSFTVHGIRATKQHLETVIRQRLDETGMQFH